MHVIKVHGILVVKVSKRSTHVTCTKSISIRNTFIIINSMITKSHSSNLIPNFNKIKFSYNNN